MKSRNILAALALTLSSSPLLASDFFSTEPSERLFNLGVRVGVNTSNRTFNKNTFNAWNVNGWGTGFDAGVILNLNMREFFTIQPGFFFESRSGNYAYAQTYINNNNEEDNYTQLGDVKSYNFTIPVMVSFRFNLSDNIKWIAEAGPYLQFKLHSSDADDILVIDQPTPSSPLKMVNAKSSFSDFGFKLGSGIMVNGHYSFNIHYLAGTSNVWKAPYAGGKNKTWTFTIGYDF